MNNLANLLKEGINKKYGGVAQFSRQTNIPYSTLNSIFKKGLDNSKFSMIIKMCRELDINVFENTVNFNKHDIDFLTKISALDEYGLELLEKLIEKEYKRSIKF